MARRLVDVGHDSQTVEPRRRTRRLTLEGAVKASGAVLAGLYAGNLARGASAASDEEDARVLKLLLVLEQAESGLYARAQPRLSGELRDYARIAGTHERDHLALVRSALGRNAPKAPELDFGDAVRDPDAFTVAATKIEELSVGAYNGQAANVSPKVLGAAARIVSVEARHAAWIRSIAGRDPAPDPTDEPITEERLRAGLRDLGVDA